MYAALFEQLTSKVSRTVLGMTLIQSQAVVRRTICARFEAWRLPRPYRLCPATFADLQHPSGRYVDARLASSLRPEQEVAEGLVSWTSFVEEEDEDRRRREQYIEELSVQQKAAVEADAKVVRVVAGPGSGKTRVLIARVAKLLDAGVPADNILLLTFTNKAAREIASRLQNLFGGHRLGGLWSGTFHSVALKILQRHVRKLKDGRKESFSICDEDESEALTLECFMEHHAPPINADNSDNVVKAKRLQKLALRREFKTKSQEISSMIALAKENIPTVHGLTGNEVAQQVFVQLNNRQPMSDFTFGYDAYHKALRERNAFDFGDLLSSVVWLLKKDAEILHTYRSKFRYIFVDEMQDTNTPQYAFLRLLTLCQTSTSNSNQLFAVGDPNQSIYGFRGARMKNMMSDMERDFGDSLKTLFLLDNFRSMAPIVRVAEEMLKRHLHEAMYRGMITQRPHSLDSQVLYTLLKDGTKEAQYVRFRIQRFVDTGLYAPDEIAILYRRNLLSSLFERELVAAKIPCWVRGNSIWKLKENKDILGFLRFVADPNDLLAFDRIYNTPSRNIGDVSYSNLQSWCAKEEIGFPRGLVGDLMETFTESAVLDGVDIPELEIPKSFKIPTRGRQGLQQLRQIFVYLRSLAKNGTVEDAIEGLMGEVGYEAYLNPEGRIDASIQNKLNNIDALTDVAKQLRDEDGRKPTGLRALSLFAQQAAILTDEESRRDKDGVQLMSIHAAKGLEFKVIFLVACEEGILPGVQDLEDEEEARVMFVALTRAKDYLVITSVQERLFQGRWLRPRPSRFIPIDSEHLDINFGWKESQ